MKILTEDKVAKLNVENGIMHVVFERDTVITLEIAKSIVEERIQLSENKAYPLYVDINCVLSIDVEAREYLKSDEAMVFALAAALHVSNPLSKFLGNLFITVDKPKKPIKMFNAESKALNWLKKYK